MASRYTIGTTTSQTTSGDTFVDRHRRFESETEFSMIGQLPQSLHPTTTLPITLPSGETLLVPRVTPTFSRWKGETPSDTFNGKPVLEYETEPLFAELVTLRLLQADGWSGTWVNSFRRTFLNSYAPPEESILPTHVRDLLASISGSDKFPTGCWDICGWRNDEVIFVECKQSKKDKIRVSQTAWLSKALSIGIGLESFLIVEWTIDQEPS